jgi:MHS family shikimate/dehydroshikimate transporter-like MFS transporter
MGGPGVRGRTGSLRLCGDEGVARRCTAARGGRPGTYFTQRLGLGFDEIAADNLLLIDEDLNVLAGSGMANPANRFHSWVYRARPDVQCIIHTHALHTATLSMLEVPLQISHRRGLYGSLVQLGYPLGVIGASTLFSMVSSLPKEDFLGWAWRLPFLISILFAGAGLYIRHRIAESPIFQRAALQPRPEKIPLVEILTQHRRAFFIAVGLKVSEIAWVSVATIVSISYVTQHLGLPRSVILNGLLCAAALELITIPLFGWLSDLYGRRLMFIIGCLFTIVFAFPLFALLDTRDPLIIAATIAVAVSLGQGIMFGPEAAWMCELFSTRLRYSGASLGCQLGGAISGGLTPLIAALLMSWAGGLTWPVSCFLMGTACITLVAAWLAPETAGRALGE